MDEQIAGSDSEPPGIYPQTVALPVLEPPATSLDGPVLEPSTSHGALKPRRNGGVAPALRASRHVISPRSDAFRRRQFPRVTRSEWNDWRWQLRLRIRDHQNLARMMRLSVDEEQAVLRLGGHLPVGITPYYASLLNPDDPYDALRKTMIPITGEFVHTLGEADDPLAEDSHMPVPGLVHRYPDRVLFLVTNFCATYCRYCTRARMVGQTGEYHFNTDQYQQALDYIEAHTEIRDVLISGGDPLTMIDESLEWLLARLQAIPHVEFLRIGT